MTATQGKSLLLKNMALLLGVIILFLLIVLSINPVRHEAMRSFALLKNLHQTDDSTGEPHFPLNEVIDWSRSRLIPNTCQTFDGYEVKIPPTTVCINSHGLRDREYSRVKKEDTIRISLYGDSHTFGWGLEIDETIGRRLEGELEHCLKKRVEVLNHGIPGTVFPMWVDFMVELDDVYSVDHNLFLLFDWDYVSGGKDLLEDVTPSQLVRAQAFASDHGADIILAAADISQKSEGGLGALARELGVPFLHVRPHEDPSLIGVRTSLSSEDGHPNRFYIETMALLLAKDLCPLLRATTE